MSLSKTPNNKGVKLVSSNLDDEWNEFITTSSINSVQHTNGMEEVVMNGDDIVNPFIKDNQCEFDYSSVNGTYWEDVEPPTATPIYISTKSKIAFLEKPIDLSIFWDIPVMSYNTAKNGIIKKQIKVNSKTQEELTLIQKKLEHVSYYDEQIITHIDNPTGRVKFKDIRKITVGIAKKDIMSYRSKKKQAFYNCFVMIMRLEIDSIFKEFHIKVFNTGKIEIPGIQNDEMYQLVLKTILDILQPLTEDHLVYQERNDTVLINSNFNCGFFIKREILYDILKNKYNLQAIYDPCSYPGIQCKFCYKNGDNHIGTVQSGVQFTTEEQKTAEAGKEVDVGVGVEVEVGKEIEAINYKKKKVGKEKNTQTTEVSFMIFRTGSVLIVGMCEDNILYYIYEFLKNIFITEFPFICQSVIDMSVAKKERNKKIRKKIVYFDNDKKETITA